MKQEEYNQNIVQIWDWIEEQQALSQVFPGYANDPVDVDREGAWV